MNRRDRLSTLWGKMAYTDAGGSELPLLFLHGTGCDSADFDAVIQALPSDLRLITLDFRGHGKSAVPRKAFTLGNLTDDVLMLIDHLQLDRVLLVGHSLGGMVAVEAASRSPHVSGLVLLEGWTRLSAGNAFDKGRFYGTLRQFAVAEIQEKAEQTRSRFAPQVWEAFWRSVAAFDGTAYLQTAPIPIIEVYGEMGKNQWTEQNLYVPSNPNIEWVWVSDAGHYLPHERPNAVASACLYAVDRVVD